MVVTIRPSVPIVITPSSEVTIIRPSPNPLVIRPSRPVTIQPRRFEPVRIEPARTLTVTPPVRQAWDDRGWQRRNENGKEIYEGFYQVGARRFRGRIEFGGRRNTQTYIHNPPPEIKKHRKSACFQQAGIGTGWFILHWRRPAANVDEAVLYMERVLAESLKR